MPLIAKQTLGMSLSGIGVLMMVGALAKLAVLPAVDRVTKRFGRLAVVLTAVAGDLAALFLIGDATNAILPHLGAIPLGATTRFLAPIPSASAIDAAPPARGPPPPRPPPTP